MLRQTSALFLLSTLACGGKSLELADSNGSGSGSGGATGANGGAQVIVTAADGDDVVEIAVDAERLYWSTGWSTGMSPFASDLKSCLKSDCDNTQVSYGDGGLFSVLEFRVHAGKIYWLSPVTPSSEPPWNLWSCSVSDCANPTLIVPDAGPFELDDGEVYYSVGDPMEGLLALPLSGSSQAPRKLPTWDEQPPNGSETSRTFSVGSDSIVWFSGPNALRMSKDGSSEPEILTDRVEATGDLVVEDDYAYWPIPLLAGRISRCSLRGCASGPELVADQQQRPRRLLIHEGQLFFQRRRPSAGNAAWEIASCPLTDCSAQHAIGTLQIDPGNQGIAFALSGAMAVDDAFVYAVAHDANAPSGALRSRMVRFPK